MSPPSLGLRQSSGALEWSWFLQRPREQGFFAIRVHDREMRFDMQRALLDFYVIEIALPQKLQRFVARKVRDGGYADASEAVREALRDFHAREDPVEQDSRELAELLLPAVAGSHRHVMDKDFDRLRKRARRKPTRP